MKQYIKDGKIFNTPIKIKEGEKTIYTNDKNILEKYGYKEYDFRNIKKSLETVIEQSNQAINEITDEKILNGFKYNDYEFYLTTENQTNFANMFIARDFLAYPQQVKTKDGFMQIDNVDEVSGFYLAGVNYIKECLEEGWKQKAEAEQRIREEYK